MEHAEGAIEIEAPLEDVMEVIEDFESYPEWADVQSAVVGARMTGISLLHVVTNSSANSRGCGTHPDTR